MKQSKKPIKKRSSAHNSHVKNKSKVLATAKQEAPAGHLRLITRQLWLLYLHSWRVRATVWYLVLSKKYKHRNVCDIYCTTYASRLRCEHVVRSPWTRFGVAFTVVLCLLVIGQLAYPRDRTLPLARLQGHGLVGFQTQSQIADKISGLDKKNVVINTQTSTTVSSFAGMGISIDAQRTYSQVGTYTTRDRLIPFSILLAGNKSVSASRNIDEVKLKDFVQKTGASNRKQAIDAVITLDGTKLAVKPAEDGYEYHLDALKQQILRSDPREESIVFSPKVLAPRISTQSARESSRQMQNRIDAPLTIKAADKTLTASSEVLASWIDILPKPQSGTIELSFNKTRVESFLSSLPSAVDQPSKPDVVTLLNGLMAGSKQGSSGRNMKFKELVEEVSSSTSSSTTTVWAKVDSILPEQIYDRQYTRDNRGIQSLIDYWAQTHNGQHGIDFRTLNDRIIASSNPHKQFSAVSSGKLFIASLISGRLDGGSLQGSAITSTGASVNSCLDRMIRLSDNACLLALGNITGWSSSDSLLRAQGFIGTALVRGGGSTTASDSSDWLRYLLNGSLTSAEQKNMIVDKLSRQINRGGIPAGSPGMTVINSAGSSRGNVYDAATVYHPRGAYILSVFSDGGSFIGISELASQINKVLYE